MHKTFWKILITLTFLLTACGQSTPALQATPQPDQPTTTSSPLPTTSPTRTALPSATLTASITPLPTIPTFTPTFDVSTIVTVTPASKAECPKENPSLTPNFPYCENHGCEDAPYHEPILEFLNAGGTHKAIFMTWANPIPFPESGFLVSKDLTGDGAPELVFSDDSDGVFIFGCSKGKYVILKNIEQIKYSYEILSTKDLNRDGLPEIVVADFDTGGARGLSIYSWDGHSFQSMAHILWYDQIIDELIMDRVEEISFHDLDHNGTIEILMRGGIASKNDFYSEGLPWREETNILAWNGSHFILSNIEYSSPLYRFQALQDADHEMSYGRFDKALTYYQDVIFNDKLDWWSKEQQKHESYNDLNSYLDLLERGFPMVQTETPTPFPTLPSPVVNTAEYPQLAAYAYYRIMLIQLVQNHETDASTVYNTLQEKFSNDPYGQPYVKMATAFWNAYQFTHKMYDGCAAAIEYAVEHSDILIPLGSDYHGWQSHIYKPEDVCPFR